jgi:hypothetical protein
VWHLPVHLSSSGVEGANEGGSIEDLDQTLTEGLTGLDETVIERFGSVLAAAVAVSILDVCQPADGNGTDYYAHWALTHFLLDGHHKMDAAAESGRPLQLLSLLEVGDSLATPEQVSLVPHLRSRSVSHRRPT